MNNQSPATIPPSYSLHKLWQMALTELRSQMCAATFNLWLADSQVMAEVSTLNFIVVAVCNKFAEEWLTYRLRPVIVRAVSGIVGHTVDVIFTYKNYANKLEIPPNSKLNLFIKGDNPMSTQQTPLPSTTSRVRIHSHVTQSKFLHVEDALNIGKIRLFAGEYRKNSGMNAHSHHFIDLADARVIFAALAHGEQGFAHKEYKGTPPQAGHLDGLGAGSEQGRRTGSGAISRVLSVKVKGQNVYIELKSGPGKLTNTGAITPNGSAEVEINVSFKLYEARRLAASVLAYIRAWDVMRMLANQKMVSKPSPYSLAPLGPNGLPSVASADNDVDKPQKKGVSKPHANNGRPVTNKTSRSKAAAKPVPNTNSHSQQKKHGEPNGRKTHPQLLQYGDGTSLSAENMTECNTYVRYRQAKGEIPPSKIALQQFYQQSVAA
ncbi:MAG: hypothetical protein GY805_39960 [Chloroflexi bacterium]|nr:hypothetical protein [Chloroflexota bacterium]